MVSFSFFILSSESRCSRRDLPWPSSDHSGKEAVRDLALCSLLLDRSAGRLDTFFLSKHEGFTFFPPLLFLPEGDEENEGVLSFSLVFFGRMVRFVT